MFVPLYLHIGPSSSSLSNAQAPVVPNVAHSYKEHTTNRMFMLCDIRCQLIAYKSNTPYTDLCSISYAIHTLVVNLLYDL